MPSAAFPTSETFAEGRRRMSEGRYSAAASAFDAYVREVPSDGRGKLARGTALLALGRIADAASAFRRAVDDYAPGEVIVFDMPALFGSRSAFRGAQGTLEDSVRRQADDLDGRFDLGVLYLFSGEREAAQSLLGGLDNDPYADRLLRQALGG
jgi:Flp pilus assembly protein TadD